MQRPTFVDDRRDGADVDTLIGTPSFYDDRRENAPRSHDKIETGEDDGLGLGEWRTGEFGTVDAFKPKRLVARFTNPEKFQEGTQERREFVGSTDDFAPGRVWNRVANKADPTNPDNWAPEWLQWLFKNPKALTTVVAGIVALYLLKPLLEIGANVSE